MRNRRNGTIVLIVSLLVAGPTAGEPKHDYRALAREWIDELGYAPVPPADGWFTRFPGVPAQPALSGIAGTDVEIGSWESPNIAINPADPLNIAVSTYFDLRVSTDGGTTFRPSVYPTGTGNVNGPNSITFDGQGRLFWAYKNVVHADSTTSVIGIDVLVARCDPTTGAILSNYPVNMTSAAGVPASSGWNNDMPWIFADVGPASPHRDRLYVTWTRTRPDGSTRIHTSWSTDQGLSWSNRYRICGSDLQEGFKWPSHGTVAPNGDLYVAYHARLYYDERGQVIVRRSTDGGASFLPSTVAFQPGDAGVTFNPAGSGKIPGTKLWLQASAHPWVLADPNDSGRIYVLAADDPGIYDPADPTNDPADVMIAISTDHGGTWDAPRRVDSGPAPSFQVMPAAAIDPASGHLVVHWYDNRGGQVNAEGDWLLDVYTAVSRDGGVTFLPDLRINDLEIDPDAGTPCFLSCGNQLLSVWGSSATDVIATGRGGMILRYDGTEWTQEASGVASHLWDVWGSSAEDVWIVGQAGRIMHWDGSSWDSAVSSPTSETLFAMWGNAADDIFAVGVRGTVVHWDGDTWSLQSSGTTNALVGVWGSAADNVLAVGLGGTVLRYNGSTWNSEPGLGTTDWLWGVWGSSSSDITVISATDGDVYHYDGTSWSRTAQLPPWTIDLHGFAWDDMLAVGVDNCRFDGSAWSLTGATPELRRAWGPATDDVFAVGTGGVIWHFDGASWSPMDSPIVSSSELLWIGARSGVASVNDRALSVWCGNWRFDGAPRGVQAILNPGLDLNAVAVPGVTGLPGVADLELDPGVPNPFGSRARLGWTIPRGGHVSLVLHDVAGRRVATLVEEYQSAGRHTLDWDATNVEVAPGVYFLRLESRGEAAVQRIVRLR